MDRNREARRTTMAATNGLPRRRHRSSGLRDSPEEDGAVELQETARLRDRGSGGKKDRDRDRDRERERDRDRERDRERDRMSRSKRRRGGERLGGDESSEESVNDEEEEDDDDGVLVAPGGGGGGSLRMLPPPNPPPATASMSSSLMNHHHHNHSHNHHGHNHHSNNQRKSFPPAKSFRAPPAALKAADEMIGVSVPRKARSASTKRSHEWSASAIGIVGDQIHRQASTSPVRPSLSATVSAAAATASASQAPVSPPSSSNASVRKKLPNGPKLRQPKPSPKPSSSAQDEIEIEIAEVLYGMMRQPQGPSKQEIMANDSIKIESREANNKSSSDANKSSSDAKSRVSSPISSSQYGAPQSSSRSSQPGGDSSVPAWAFCVAPKRKKPRLVKYDGKYEDAKSSFVPSQNNPVSSTAKIPTDQSAKTDASSANLEKNAGSAAENGGIAPDTAQSHAVPPSSEAQPEPIKLENCLVSDSKPVAAEKSDGRDLGLSKEEPQSPKKESPGLRLDDKRETTTATKTNSTTSEIESQREEKFQIDLMAPPPSRSSPERDAGIDFVAVDAKPMAIDTETEIKPVIKEDAKVLKLGREQVEPANVEPEKPKAAIASATSTVEESESKKLPAVVGNKERNIDLQLDLEKTDVIRESVSVGVGGNKLHQLALPRQHQQQPPPQPNNEKPAQSGALPLPTMPMAAWPGGLPPMGYMTPLQGVVSMDGSAVSSAAIQPQPYIFNQPRPKRCATHCYIARSISVHQQIARMNSFWPAAATAGSGPLYGAKPCNLNVVPSSADMHSNIPGGRGVNPVQDKGQGLAMFPGHNGKDKASQAAAGVVDSAHRKQILLQQPLPPGAPSNILQGPTAIIFPLSQQQAVAAAAASVRPGSVKSPPAAGNATTSSGSNSTAAAASATAAAAAAAAAAGAPAMTFNYPNMAGNEHPQYLAINAYSFPIPAHVGAPPAYRGTHPQAVPFFNGSFYSTFHPSQLQQQQPPAHSQQSQQGHQNPSMSSGSSSSQKHLQNQQQSQRQPHTGGVNAGSGGSLQGFPTSKNPPSQPMQMQQRQQQQQQQGQHMAHPARQLESEMGNEDSPSTADSRVSRPSMSIYGQNFAMPMHAPNFALMTPASMAAAGGANSGSGGGANGSGGGNGEKKQLQQQGQKGGGVEPSQAFALSFGAINGAPTGPPGLDITSLAQQQAIFPDIRQGYQQYMAVAAAAAQAQAAAHHKKNYRGPEDVKAAGDSSNVEEDRKAMKGSSGVSQSIAFSRPDLSDASGNALPGATVVDSSARTLNLGSAQQRSSGSVMPAGMTNANASSAQQQLQRNQQQQQQQHIMQMQKQQQQQQQQLAAAARTKTPPTSNGSVYSDHLSSSMAAKFPNALSTFPQSLVHSSSSPAHSPQWKNTARSTTAQVPSPSMTSSTSSSLKNLSQQQSRVQQTHTQISFAAANSKPAVTQSPGLQPVNSNQSPSPPIMVGSPTTSSVSKSAGGSPRTATNSTSTGNKVGQASSLSSQQAKNSPSVPNMKSSPAAGKNVPSILGNPHITSSSGATGNKSQLAQQQPQLSKQSLQQAQLFFSSYIPTQAHPNSTTATTAAAAPGGYYTQRRRPEQQQQLQGASGTSSSGMLSLSPSVTLSNTSTSDPAKAAAAANMKGLPSQALMHPAQFAAAAAAAAAAAQSGNPHQILPAGFSYVHTVPAAVQMKPAEQKQPAGE